MRTGTIHHNEHKATSTTKQVMVIQSSFVPGMKRKKPIGIAIAIPTLDNVVNNRDRHLNHASMPNFNSKRQRGNNSSRNPAASTKFTHRSRQKNQQSKAATEGNRGKNEHSIIKKDKKKKSNKTNNNHMGTKNAKMNETKSSATTINCIVTKQQSSTPTANLLDNAAKQPMNKPIKKHQAAEKPAVKIEKLVIPRKHNIRTMLPRAPLPEIPEPATPVDGHARCPYCRMELNLTKSRILSKAFRAIKRKNKEDQEKQAAKTCAPGNSTTIAQNGDKKQPMLLKDQYAFCRLHEIELVLKPLGKANDWPAVIVFDTLKARILGLKKELDMVISQAIGSSFHDSILEVYKVMGKNKARSITQVMARFDRLLPGYYGPRGAYLIQKQLADMYLHPGKLHEDLTTPQTPLEYLQQVLIPEVGYRLIRQDLISKDKSKMKDPEIDLEAKSVMTESTQFGCYLQRLDWGDYLPADDE